MFPDNKRRIWVRRANKPPTTLYVSSYDIVDDVKTLVAQKYPTTLGRHFDPADIQLRMSFNTSMDSSRSSKSESARLSPANGSIPKRAYDAPISPISPIPIPLRSSGSILNRQLSTSDFHNEHLSGSLPNTTTHNVLLGADQSVWKLLDLYFPHGMTMHDAFIIESPEAKSSPETGQVAKPEAIRSLPYEEPAEPHCRSASTSPNLSSIQRKPHSNPHSPTSTVLLLPRSNALAKSNERRRRHIHDSASEHELKSDSNSSQQTQDKTQTKAQPEITSVVSPSKTEPTKIKSSSNESSIKRKPKSALDKVLPSVNVLIVEDNKINAAILSAFLRKNHVRYSVAKNGEEAIEKWRQGGYHLVLMDIQLPVISGIDCTREIRRLEKLNQVGVFVRNEDQQQTALDEEDKLDTNIFRSPVIIVALTASTSDIDKRKALAAGCNDFLTKPVNLVWLANKIKEWGCMQALIDFDSFKGSSFRDL
ncbi:BA75_03675T0 [Komagataella pastoris]|uniref:BA75_03675T0 n=1 Tax=Komagataella pastoris TaxID=4922 RepID=A0A1B2JGQ3_PICPA|nr:BA75_03675T0 [Komagataella pastoris]